MKQSFDQKVDNLLKQHAVAEELNFNIMLSHCISDATRNDKTVCYAEVAAELNHFYERAESRESSMRNARYAETRQR